MVKHQNLGISINLKYIIELILGIHKEKFNNVFTTIIAYKHNKNKIKHC